VLDLTRVIAGPTATRDLAFAGVDVLQVDSTRRPEIAAQHLDTGHGKRSTRLDLASVWDRRIFEDLLSAADVVVTGYRPGALDRYGLSPDALWQRPWARRRGHQRNGVKPDPGPTRGDSTASSRR